MRSDWKIEMKEEAILLADLYDCGSAYALRDTYPPSCELIKIRQFLWQEIVSRNASF